MSDFYSNYSYPNTPFVFDKIYETETDLNNSSGDGVFVTRYVLVEENTTSGEKAVVYQKIIGEDKTEEYKKIVVLDYSNQAEDWAKKHMNETIYGKEDGSSTDYEETSIYGKLISDTEQLDILLQNYTENGGLVWNDLDAQEEAITE